MTGNEVKPRARRGGEAAPASAKRTGTACERAKSRDDITSPRTNPNEIDGPRVGWRSGRAVGIFCFFAQANSLKKILHARPQVSRFPAPTAVRARLPKGDVALRSASLFRTTSPSPTYTNTSAKMASAMCTVETVNGREYKVRDMAMADFGCVSDPPDGREHFPRHAFLRRFSAIAASRSTLRSARGSRDSSGLARRSRA